ncbi:MAG: hypothetical protein AAF138_03765, partial [Planctomycetota bacterium]
RHRYEVEPTAIERLEAHGLIFSGRHPSQPIMQILELAQPDPEATEEEQPAKITHPYFVAAQFHPELTSRPLRPQPVFMGLVAAALSRRFGSELLDAEPDIASWVRRQARSPRSI